MKRAICRWSICLLLAFFTRPVAAAGAPGVVTVFETNSVYHQMVVEDEGDIRTLRFNGSWETKMSKSNPLKGHFEYTEYFQMPFVWNPNIKHVLMAGLGGGSTQRAYQHYFTNVMVDTIEIDPVVVKVAHDYFGVNESPTLKMHVGDARPFLRRATNDWDLILMDAYTTTRYGSSLPKQLTTKEFFETATAHLGTNGILGYNVIGQIRGGRQSIIGALYRTMASVFPQVYLFPAEESQNVVFICTKSTERFDKRRVQQEGAALLKTGRITLPTFSDRCNNLWTEGAPAAAATSPLLTDDYGPIESLLQGTR